MINKTNNKTKLTLGSLFSGSGGFELAGVMAGIEPVWASEIAPFPIRVTTKRFPDMKHYGDVSTLDGAEYAMWGNGVALPCAFYVLNGIAKINVIQYEASKSAPL